MEEKDLKQQMIAEINATTNIEQLRADYVECWDNWMYLAEQQAELSANLSDAEAKLEAAEAKAKKTESDRNYYRDEYYKALARNTELSKIIKSLAALITD